MLQLITPIYTLLVKFIHLKPKLETILKTQIQIKYKNKRYLFIILLVWWGISMQGIWLKMVVFLHPYDEIVYWNILYGAWIIF
jgi:hypothetical protein